MGVSQPALNQPLARGRTADIYAWVEQSAIEQEAEISRLVHAASIPVPWTGEVVEVEGRSGLIFESWTPVVAAARLSEGIVEEEERVLAIAREGLQ